MPEIAEFFVPEPGAVNPTPSQINALLFYQLGQFIVWGERHRELVASYPDLMALLKAATIALSGAGMLEHPSRSDGADTEATNRGKDSQTLVSAALTGEGGREDR